MEESKRSYRCAKCAGTIDMFNGGIAIDGENYYHLPCYVAKHEEEKKRATTFSRPFVRPD